MIEQRLVQWIKRTLKAEPHTTVRELVALHRKFGQNTEKQILNGILYRYPQCFSYEGNQPPHWRLASTKVDVARSMRAARTKKKLAKLRVAPKRKRTAKPVSLPRGALRTRPVVVRPEISADLPDLYPWQMEALTRWRAKYSCGVVEAVTGTGKTTVGLAAAEDELRRGGKVLVVVPTQELQRQWRDELVKRFIGAKIGKLGGGSYDLMDNVDVLVAIVNSARVRNLKPPGGQGLLIADVCHRYGSAHNKNALNTKFPRRLGLSATFARNDMSHLETLEPYFGRICFKMEYRRAIRDKVVARFKVATVGVSFSKEEYEVYEDQSRQMGTLKRKLINHGATKEPFAKFIQDVSNLKKNGSFLESLHAGQFLSVFYKRRELMASTPVKFDALRLLGPSIRSANRTIVFTETIASAERALVTVRRLGIRGDCIHSRMLSVRRREALKQFGAGRLTMIAAPKVLDEGIDVPEADLAIIVAGSKTERQMIQRMGRVLRIKEDGRLARFVVLYVKKTSEDPALGAHESFLKKLTEVADATRDFSLSRGSRAVTDYLRPKTARHKRSSHAN